MPTLIKFEIPSTLRAWQIQEVERRRAQLETETYEKEGALFWSSVDRPVPMDVFRDAYVATPAWQEKARDAYTLEVVSAYRARRAEHGYSAEERAEIRANFEPGTTVVDVFTGARFDV